MTDDKKADDKQVAKPQETTPKDPKVETRLNEAVEAVVKLTKELSSTDLKTRHRIGGILKAIYDDQSSLYGAKTFETIAARITQTSGMKCNVSTLYDFQTLAAAVTEIELDAHIKKGANYSQLLSLVRRLPGSGDDAAKRRLEFIEAKAALPVREFRKAVEDLPKADDAGGNENRGGGSRTGTGHGKAMQAPAKKMSKLIDSVIEVASDVFVLVEELNKLETIPDNQAQVDGVADALNELDAKFGGLGETLEKIGEAINVFNTKTFGELKARTSARAKAAPKEPEVNKKRRGSGDEDLFAPEDGTSAKPESKRGGRKKKGKANDDDDDGGDVVKADAARPAPPPAKPAEDKPAMADASDAEKNRLAELRKKALAAATAAKAKRTAVEGQP